MKLLFDKMALDLTDPKMQKIVDMNTDIVVHNGQFHADDAFSVALVLIVRECFNDTRLAEAVICEMVHRQSVASIIENSPEDLGENPLFLDMKDGDFDHHFNDPEKLINVVYEGKEQPKGVPYTKSTLATFGTIWMNSDVGKCFDCVGFKIPKGVLETQHVNLKSIHETIYWKHISSIDLRDNFGKKYESPISDIIRNMNFGSSTDDCIYAVPEKYKKANPNDDRGFKLFINAVLICKNILEGWIFHEQQFYHSIEMLFKPFVEFKFSNKNGNEYVVLKENEEKETSVNLDAVKLLFPDVKFLINETPDVRGNTYRAVVIDSEVWKFPEQYLETPAEGQQFMHAQRFLTTFDTLDNLHKFADNV